MSRHLAHKGPIAWIVSRLAGSYWSLPLTGIVAFTLLALVLLHIDGGFIADAGLSPVASATAAHELAIVSAGVSAAFVTLYFSLVLLVLTLATGNLGIRLIDRWLHKRLVRVSIAGLSANLAVALVAVAAIDPDAPAVAQLPLVLVWLVLVLDFASLVMLPVALHDLGRTIFVDRSIVALAEDIDDNRPEIEPGADRNCDWGQTIVAPRDGYLVGMDLDGLRKRLADHPGVVRFVRAPGQHVMAGEPLVLLEHGGADEHAVGRAIPIARFRSNAEGAVFQIRLLVEIAARALSPAINDFYTALAVADRMGEAMAAARGLWVGENAIARYAEEPRFELIGQDFRGLFEDPLHAFRQSAAAYPPVAIRMVENMGRVAGRTDVRGTALADWLREQGALWVSHARDHAETDTDRAAIARALRYFEPKEDDETR